MLTATRRNAPASSSGMGSPCPMAGLVRFCRAALGLALLACLLQASAVHGQGPDAAEATCTVKFDSCSSSFIPGGTCVPSTACPLGIDVSLNGAAHLVTAVAAAVTHGGGAGGIRNSSFAAFVNEVGLLQIFQTALATVANETAVLNETAAGACGIGEVNIFLGSIIAATPTCASNGVLVNNYYMILADSLNGVSGCMALDPCSFSVVMSFPNSTADAGGGSYPTATRRLLTGSLISSASIPLDNTGVSLTGWMPNINPALGSTNQLVRAHINAQGPVDVAINNGAALQVRAQGAGNILYSFNPTGAGIASRAHSYVLQLLDGGAVSTFGPNVTVDMSGAQAAQSTLSWTYLGSGSWSMTKVSSKPLNISDLMSASTGSMAKILAHLFHRGAKAQAAVSVSVTPVGWSVNLNLHSSLMNNGLGITNALGIPILLPTGSVITLSGTTNSASATAGVRSTVYNTLMTIASLLG